MEKEEKTIGSRIAKIRGELRQVDFAERIGVGRTTVIRYEANERPPDANFLRRLVEVFGVDPAWLLMGGERPAQEDLAVDERLLLEKYRASSQAGKDAILGAALGQGQAGFTQKYAGGVGQVVESVAGDGLSFNVTMPAEVKPKRSKK